MGTGDPIPTGPSLYAGEGLMEGRAFFWVACKGDGRYPYEDEARQSAHLVRKHMPDIDRILLTDRSQAKGKAFTRVVAESVGEAPWYIRSVRYWNRVLELGYDKLIGLDTDAWLLAPVYELFDMLDRFDFMAAHEGPRQTLKREIASTPRPFSEPQIGVIAFRNNEAIQALFARWLEIAEARPDIYGVNDQSSLREAIWRDDRQVQFYVFPSEWNCRFHFGTWVRLKVKILHGRSKDIGKVEREVNRQAGKMRAWRPKELLRL